MYFLGDLSCPNYLVDKFNQCISNTHLFDNEVVVVNLEATIFDNDGHLKDSNLINGKKVLEGFSSAEKVVVSLANNHMYDYPEQIQPTIDYLRKQDIGVFGICDEDGNSYTPFEYQDKLGVNYAFFGHCWRLYTHTNVNRTNDIRVVDHPYDEFIRIVSEYKKRYPQTKVYCFMHWNYDLEKLPFPMHIKIAHDLIDKGADGVIGSHSHRPQGVEIYKGKPIAYCLGNFYLPSHVYFNGELVYPEYSKDTYGLKIENNKYSIQWFRTDNDEDTPIVACNLESFDGARISDISGFRKLGFKEYVNCFRENRVKKLLVPVFIDYKGLGFCFKEFFAIIRVKLLRKILK